MTRANEMSFAGRMSEPFVVKNPFESIAGRKRWVSIPLPLFGSMAFCAPAQRAIARKVTPNPMASRRGRASIERNRNTPANRRYFLPAGSGLEASDGADARGGGPCPGVHGERRRRRRRGRERAARLGEEADDPVADDGEAGGLGDP